MAPTQIVPGASLGARYVVKELLGSGSMARVYRAYDPRLDLYVALKVLPPQLAMDPTFVERFRREGRTLARLKHDHILRLYDIHEDEAAALYYLVLEHLTGGTLKSRIGGTPWQVSDVVQLLRPVAAALDFAHTQVPTVVHRDLKPANIMFDDRERIVVSDFGLARMLLADDTAAPPDQHQWHSLSAGQFLGTPQYAAPEQAEGRPGTAASDRYSLGVIAYELLVGTVPFIADTPLATLLSVGRDPLPLPTALNPDLDSPVERVLLKALARRPEDRFPTAREFLEGLATAGQLTVAPLWPGEAHQASQMIPELLEGSELRIEGSPPGAVVRVNGLARGGLPCIVDMLPSGEHLVEVATEGFLPAAVTVVLPRSEPVTVHLKPAAGKGQREDSPVAPFAMREPAAGVVVPNDRVSQPVPASFDGVPDTGPSEPAGASSTATEATNHDTAGPLAARSGPTDGSAALPVTDRRDSAALQALRPYFIRAAYACLLGAFLLAALQREPRPWQTPLPVVASAFGVIALLWPRPAHLLFIVVVTALFASTSLTLGVAVLVCGLIGAMLAPEPDPEAHPVPVRFSLRVAAIAAAAHPGLLIPLATGVLLYSKRGWWEGITQALLLSAYSAAFGVPLTALGVAEISPSLQSLAAPEASGEWWIHPDDIHLDEVWSAHFQPWLRAMAVGVGPHASVVAWYFAAGLVGGRVLSGAGSWWWRLLAACVAPLVAVAGLEFGRGEIPDLGSVGLGLTAGGAAFVLAAVLRQDAA